MNLARLTIFAVNRFDFFPHLDGFPEPDLDDQQLWRACIGLDLADRTVLEAEVLILRIVRQKSATLGRQSSVPGERDVFI